MKNKLLTAKEAAERLGYKEDWVRALARDGKLRGFRRRQQWFFDPEDVDGLLTPNFKEKKTKAKSKDAKTKDVKEKKLNGDSFDLG